MVSNDEIINIFKAAIAPNPNTGQFRLEVEDLPIGEWQIEIYSITGQLIETKIQSILQPNTQIPIELQDVSKGMYLLKMRNEGRVILTRKFIVNNGQ